MKCISVSVAQLQASEFHPSWSCLYVQHGQSLLDEFFHDGTKWGAVWWNIRTSEYHHHSSFLGTEVISEIITFKVIGLL